jgi:hypothetical protein
LDTSVAATRTKVGAEDGKWRSIDTTLESSEDGAAPVAPALPMVFSPGGDEHPLARIERGEEWLEYWWPDVLPEPVLAGDRATYPSVFDGVDLVVSVSPDGTGFSEVLVVTSAEAAAQLPETLSLRMATSDGIQLTPGVDGRGFVVADAAGEQVFDAPQPVMWDSSGPASSSGNDERGRALGIDPGDGPLRSVQPLDGDRVADVAMTASTKGQVDLVPDDAMLSDAETRWPVYIDPSLSGSRNFWTMVQSALPTSTAGYKFSGDEGVGLCDVQVKSECNVDNVKRLAWGFGGLNSTFGTDVSSAVFRAYGVHSYSCDPKTVNLKRVDSFGSSATWNTLTGWGDSRTVDSRWVAHKSACPNDLNRYIEFDATSAAQWAADNRKALYLGLRAATESTMSGGWKRYKYNAMLSITYNSPPNKPTNLRTTSPTSQCASFGNGPWLSDNTPIFRAKFTDPEGQNVKGQFQYWRWNGSDWVGPTSLTTSLQAQGEMSRQASALSDTWY